MVSQTKKHECWKTGRVKFCIIHCLELDFVGVHLQSLFHRGTQISFILVSSPWVGAMREGWSTVCACVCVLWQCHVGYVRLWVRQGFAGLGAFKGNDLVIFPSSLVVVLQGRLKIARRLLYYQEVMGFWSLTWLRDHLITDYLFTAVLRNAVLSWCIFIYLQIHSLCPGLIFFEWVSVEEGKKCFSSVCACKLGCMMYLSTVRVLPTIDGSWHALSLERQSGVLV